MTAITLLGAVVEGTNGSSISYTTAHAPTSIVDSVVLVCWEAACSQHVQVSTISDTMGLTWQNRWKATNLDDQGVTNQMELWWAHAPAGYNGEITITNTGTISEPNSQAVCTMLFQNVNPTEPFTTGVQGGAGQGLALNPSTSTATEPQVVNFSETDYSYSIAFATTRSSTSIPLGQLGGYTSLGGAGQEPAVGQNRSNLTVYGDAFASERGVTSIILTSMTDWMIVQEGLINFTPPPPPPPPKTQGTFLC